MAAAAAKVFFLSLLKMPPCHFHALVSIATTPGNLLHVPMNMKNSRTTGQPIIFFSAVSEIQRSNIQIKYI